MPHDPLATFDLFGERVRPAAEAVLKRRFVFPPFTVLNAREGDWQERKRAWLLTGIRSELGRGVDLLQTGANSAYGGNGFAGNRGRAAAAAGVSFADADLLVHGAKPGALEHYRDSEQAGNEAGKPFATIGNLGDVAARAEARGGTEASSTSVFDPVLCELAYRWFAPPGGKVLDPFAGGSVRGVVASCLGREYYGIDLSAPQIAANVAQLPICGMPAPMWVRGDSRDARDLLPGLRADFLFSCPPYADLERYSDDPADLSTLDYPEFRAAYAGIIAECAAMLAPDSFACFVVGDVRGRDGNYYGFPHDTAAAFKAAGMPLYNEAILITSVGSLPVRINAQFRGSRKLGKTHQNVLVFLKGDAKRAAAKCEKMGQEFDRHRGRPGMTSRMLRLKDRAAWAALREKIGSRFATTQQMPPPARPAPRPTQRGGRLPPPILTETVVRPKGRFGIAKAGGYGSKKEAQRAFILKLMQDAGEIRGLREHPRYLLIPAQRDAKGKTLERACEYVGDFAYEEFADGAWRPIVEDCKTEITKTPQYRVKRKLMLFVHKIRVRET